jgi:hypothetical protein
MGYLVFAEDIKDIKPPVYFPANFSPLIIIGILILLVALVWLISILIKRFSQRKENITPQKPAHQIAYEALQDLRRKNLPYTGRIKEYYSELSDIVRRYIEARFNIRAAEMTTEEFLFSLRDSDDLTGAQKNLLKEFLTQCDMVKFAKYGPLEKEIEDSFLAAKRFVSETKIDGPVK